MEVYRATVIDKVANPTSEEPASYESYVVIDDKNDGTKTTDWQRLWRDLEEISFKDDQIHYYFSRDEWENGLHDGEIETEEFKYIIGERVK